MDDVVVDEANGFAEFRIWLGVAVTVQYATADWTASGVSSDYDGQSGTLSFQPGETVKAVRIPIKIQYPFSSPTRIAGA